MPAKKKSAAQLALSGTLKRNPGRYAERPCTRAVSPIGYCPKSLSEPEREIWKALVRSAPEGLLTSSDEMAVELCARLIHHTRTATTLKASEVSTLANLLGKLGLTPYDRQRITLPDPPPQYQDEWMGF